jgi:hypothetical protein
MPTAKSGDDFSASYLELPGGQHPLARGYAQISARHANLARPGQPGV